MSSTTVQAAAYTLAPIGATIAGGTLAAYRPPRPRVTSAIQHTAAGVVFAAVALEIIPHVSSHSTVATVAGFAVGIAAMLGLGELTRHLEAREAAFGSTGADVNDIVLRANAGLLVATGLDVLIDGLVLGAGFAAGPRQGILLAVALTLELLFLGLSTAAALASAGAARWQVVASTSLLTLPLLLGAVAGAAVLGGVSATVLAGVLAFGAVALMYLVTEQLLVEAHEVEETPWATALFFVGFLVYLVISELTD